MTEKFKIKNENWIVIWCPCGQPVPIKFNTKFRACWYTAKCSDCGQENRFKYFHKIPNTQEQPVTISSEHGIKGVMINKDNWKKIE